MRIFDGIQYRDATAEEIYARQAEEQSQMNQPMSVEEVLKRLITTQINSLSVDDTTALRMRRFYPEWTAGESYPLDFKVQRSGKLWKTIQAHTSMAGWEPENAASLWVQINETHAGTLNDPIPYEGNMVLENGKFYSQSSSVYKCTRDTVNPVYAALSELVGLYVEVVE